MPLKRRTKLKIIIPQIMNVTPIKNMIELLLQTVLSALMIRVIAQLINQIVNTSFNYRSKNIKKVNQNVKVLSQPAIMNRL